MTKRHPDQYSNYFDYHFDPMVRRLFLYGDIDEDSVGLLIMGLLIMESETTEKPIEIVMSSCGGDEYEMLAAYDIIRSLKSRVIATAVGKIMSAAPLILAAADEARCYPHTRFMVHCSSYHIDGKHYDAKRVVEENEKLEKLWANMMATRTKLSAQQWIRMTKNKPDEYFDAETAKEYGIVDEIIAIT
jgi:ATP-dependent Clp protease protease subunit